MKKVIMIAVSVLFFVGCGEIKKTADDAIQEKQRLMMKEAQRQTGLPSVKNFQEKKMLKMLYELRDQENLVCHAYLFNSMSGKVGQYLGKCIGYGLPASTQYSNPSKFTGVTTKKVYNSVGDGFDIEMGYEVMPQAEPNGLFVPEGLSATWLMMVDPKTGTPRPVYIEPEVIVSPFKLQ